MKKTLTVLASAVLALGMLFVMGCKTEPNLDAENLKAWKGVKNYDTTGGKTAIKIVADNAAIEWWAITDTNNKVLASSIDYEKGSSKSTEIKHTGFKEVEITDVTDKKEVALWIRQSVLENKDKQKDASVFCGTITAHKGKGYVVNASGKREEQPVVGILKINCDEYRNHNHTWHGDYKITVAAPLLQVKGVDTPKADDDEYKAVANLMVNANISENSSKYFVWPAGTNRVALHQPNRFNPDSNEIKGNDTLIKKENDAKEKQKNWYWTKEVVLNKWGTATVNSSECDKAVPINGGKLADAAEGDRSATNVVILKESDFITPVDAAEMK